MNKDVLDELKKVFIEDSNFLEVKDCKELTIETKIMIPIMRNIMLGNNLTEIEEKELSKLLMTIADLKSLLNNKKVNTLHKKLKSRLELIFKKASL